MTELQKLVLLSYVLIYCSVFRAINIGQKLELHVIIIYDARQLKIEVLG